MPEQRYLEAGKKRFMADGAYAALQSTKPQSLAPALTESPAGLAAWIVDRFNSWHDGGGALDEIFTKDELLTNIMIYWVTKTIGPSMRTYRADAVSPSLTSADRVGVPVGLALFPKDIGGVPPRAFAERTLNVERWSEMPSGSHFAPLEEPDLYAQDVTAFLRDLEATR
jgi:pimeloyl-ACP methyl ester carboxylesterase